MATDDKTTEKPDAEARESMAKAGFCQQCWTYVLRYSNTRGWCCPRCDQPSMTGV